MALVHASIACADLANVDAHIWRADAELLAAIRETVWPSEKTLDSDKTE